MEQLYSADDIVHIKDEWNALYEASAQNNVFLTATWIENWMRCFSREKHLVMLNREENCLKSIGVFCRESKGYSSISTAHSYWPGILVGPKCCVQFSPYLEYMIGKNPQGHVFLNGVIDSISFRENLENEVCDSFYVVFRNSHFTRSIRLEKSMTDYLKTRPGDVRKELSRKRRKMEKALPNAKLLVYDSLADLTRVFEKIEEIERNTWKFDAKTAIVCDENEKKFYRGIIGFDERDIKGLSFVVENNDIPIAFIIGIVHKRCFYALKTSYKKSYASLSPGQVIFYQAIEYLTNNGNVSEIELLGSDSRWKKELATNKQMLCDVLILKKSISSGLYVLLRKYTSPILRKILNMLYVKEKK